METGLEAADADTAGDMAPTRLFYIVASSRRLVQVFVLPYRRITAADTGGQQILAAACLQRLVLAPADRTVIFSAGLDSIAVRGDLGSATENPPTLPLKHAKHEESRASAVSASREIIASFPPTGHAVTLSILRGTTTQPITDRLSLLLPLISAPFRSGQWQDPRTTLRILSADVVSRAQTADAVIQSGGAQPSVAPAHIAAGSTALRYFQEMRDGVRRDAEEESRDDSLSGPERDSPDGAAEEEGRQSYPAQAGAVPSSLEQLLRQGDKDRIREVLALSTPAEIVIRVRSLTSGAVVLLLRRLAEYCSEPGAVGVRSALKWIMEVCRERRDLLRSSAEARTALGAVERSMDARMCYYPLLQGIHDTIYANVNRIEESRTLQEPLVTMDLFVREAVDEGFVEPSSEISSDPLDEPGASSESSPTGDETDESYGVDLTDSGGGSQGASFSGEGVGDVKGDVKGD